MCPDEAGIYCAYPGFIGTSCGKNAEDELYGLFDFKINETILPISFI